MSRLAEKAWIQLLDIAPLRAYTSAVRAIASVPVPRSLRGPLLGFAGRRVGMDLAEAEHAVEQYRSFSDLFVRRLRDGARPVDQTARVVSPVDGVVSAAGPIEDEQLLQAKGSHYRLSQLVEDAALADALSGGVFATLYLRPKDYHRIHAPFGGAITSCRRIPGRLLPVQPSVVRGVPGLFVQNERLVIAIETPMGAAAVVAVGAAAVGAIDVLFGHAPASTYRTPPPIGKGDELASFNLGSTAIVLWPRAMGLPSIESGQEIRVGRPMVASDEAVS